MSASSWNTERTQAAISSPAAVQYSFRPTYSNMGIRSVAIYTEPDRYGLHVKRADEAYSLGEDPLAGYLDPARIVNLALETGCDAIHPGYGFLSENARFAQLCEQHGITFIGPGVRVDTAIYTGYEIPPYYDSMCLKLVVWALTWDEVIARGKRALDDMRLHGITTTANYYQQILDHPDFRAGVFDTSFVPSHPELLNYSAKRHPSEIALAIAATIAAHAGW